VICSACKTDNPDTNKFCSECGARFEEAGSHAAQDSLVEGKKQATVFFSDLSGFTAMSERLDAEEVTDIMQVIFSASTAIVNKQGGRVDKFMGDCVMAVFGIPQANEDDAVRAIHAAMEIHAAVDALNTPTLEAKTGRKLSMHTGINTGMVVSGDLDIQKGTEKILGDTVNVASRLSGVAGQGEILVGRDTFVLAD
jgi:class 3 adenylate cyclase